MHHEVGSQSWWAQPRATAGSYSMETNPKHSESNRAKVMSTHDAGIDNDVSKCADYMTDLSTAFLRQARVEKILEQHWARPKHIAAMLEEDMEVAIKVVVVGNGAVGKSSMIQRYCKGIFTKDYKKTIGVDFLERQIM